MPPPPPLRGSPSCCEPANKKNLDTSALRASIDLVAGVAVAVAFNCQSVITLQTLQRQSPSARSWAKIPMNFGPCA